MISKTISAELTQETETTVLQDLDTVSDMLPFLVNLSREDRKRIFYMSRKKLDFMERSLRYAQENPLIVPPYLDMTEFVKDVNLRTQLYRIFDKVNTFHKRLKDTLSVLEAEAYEASRNFYAAVKVAAQRGEKGAEEIVKDLHYHYKQQKSEEKATQPEQSGKTDGGEQQAA